MGSKRETKSVPPSEYATSGFSSHHREDFIAYIIFVLICAVLIPGVFLWPVRKRDNQVARQI